MAIGRQCFVNLYVYTNSDMERHEVRIEMGKIIDKGEVLE